MEEPITRAGIVPPFPTTPELFTVCQEKLTGRELTEIEQEVTAIWVPIFNKSYEDGKAQDKQALLESIDRMDKLITEHGEDEFFGSFLKSARWWIIYAWEQGRKVQDEN